MGVSVEGGGGLCMCVWGEGDCVCVPSVPHFIPLPLSLPLSLPLPSLSPSLLYFLSPLPPSIPHFVASLPPPSFLSLPPSLPPSVHVSLPHRRDIGLEKFFKKTLLNSVRRKNLRTLVLNAFQQYETLTMEGCIFQFFNLLAKCHTLDLERFTNCAVGVSTRVSVCVCE